MKRLQFGALYLLMPVIDPKSRMAVYILNMRGGGGGARYRKLPRSIVGKMSSQKE